MKKFNTYALSASQQSGRTQIPEINEISKIEYQKDILNNKNILMFDENLEGKELGKISINLNQDILIIIGPEEVFLIKKECLYLLFSKKLS